MLQVFRDSRPFEQAMDSTAIYGYRMRGRAYYFLNQFDSASADFRVALRNDPKDETTISFFNDLKRRNPAGASRPDSDRQSESYNAALRAMQLGYRNVLWCRGGLSSWMAAKQQLQPPAAVRGVIN